MKILLICATILIVFFSYFWLNKYKYREVSYDDMKANVRVNIFTNEECTLPEGNALIKGLQKYYPALCKD